VQPAVQRVFVYVKYRLQPCLCFDINYDSTSLLCVALQAFSVQQSALQGISSADLACGKRCTFLQLGRMQPRPVNVVGYSFVTFDRAVAVSVEVQRGWAGRSAGHVKLRQMQWRQTQAASGGLVELQQPFKVCLSRLRMI
jgi:hypothetical protein